MPPAPPMLPGSYNFARAAWFQGIAATGSALGPVEIMAPGGESGAIARTQRRLSAHIQAQLAGSPGGIAAAFASGDRGAIAEADEAAMRDSGLTHLLSVSGLHVGAVIAGAYFLAISLLALWPWLALRVRLPVVSAGIAALAGVGYTLLTGAEVPTVRSCAGALLVLLALALGREPLSLRLLAVAALLVMLLWPEAVVGPSFQMSFASVLAIVSLHDSSAARRFLAPREESWWTRRGRGLAMLLLTGVVIELALMPVAFYHFHRAGLYGALANTLAIPLTTFVSMPLIALALLFDSAGAGTPLWWLAGKSVELLLALAHWTAARPGAVNHLPAMGEGRFIVFIGGALWLALWRGRVRLLGLIPATLAALSLTLLRPPDMLVSGDGRHAGITGAVDGKLLVLREGRSSYARDNLTEIAGMAGETVAMADWPGARCSRDFCAVDLARKGRTWHLLFARGFDPVAERDLAAACDVSDVVIAARWLPRSCRPRWLKADRTMLEQSGGLAIDLANRRIETVAGGEGRHGWWRPPTARPSARPQPRNWHRKAKNWQAGLNTKPNASCPSVSEPVRAQRASVIAPQQAGELALHLNIAGRIELWIVGGIGRIEPDHASLAAQVLERGFLAAHQRDDDLAITRVVGAADQRIIAIENPRLDHRIARHLKRIVLARAEQGGGHRQHRLALERLDRHTGGDAAMQRNLDDIVGRLARGCGFHQRCQSPAAQSRIAVRRSAGRCLGRDILGLLEHFESARAVGQAADEAALLERRDQPVHSRFRLEIKRFLHFLERRRDAGCFQPLLNEADQFVLLAREHAGLPLQARSSVNECGTIKQRFASRQAIPPFSSR